jgi:hypothetical protein
MARQAIDGPEILGDYLLRWFKVAAFQHGLGTNGGHPDNAYQNRGWRLLG